jgi:methyl-accepting chemotaxis protein
MRIFGFPVGQDKAAAFPESGVGVRAGRGIATNGIGRRRLLGRGRRDKLAAMQELLEAAQEIARLSRSLVTTSMEGAKKSNEQRTRILDVGLMEERIRLAAEQSGVNSRETASRTGAVAQDTDRGNETMEATTRTMQEMAETVSKSAQLMQEFAERMAEVDRIVLTVGEIARQTNLLALNAAIEAANAGKAGDGFSVIAREIRVLADRTSASTTEIGEKIGRMSASAKAAERSMQVGKAAVETSIRQNLEVQQSFQGIRNAMHEVERMSAQVAGASDKQILAVERVTASVQKIDHLAGECTQEADASAEMSMKMVTCTARLYEGLANLHAEKARAMEAERRATESMVSRVEEHESRVRSALELLKKLCAQAGSPVVRGRHAIPDVTVPAETIPGLYFGPVKAIDGGRWVDQVHARTGCVATVFVRDGDRLIRVATNVKRPDGQRATGTVLNPKGLAMERLMQRRSHFGAVYVLGKPFVGGYEPVLSATGELIGALYTGFALAESETR